MTRPRPSSGQAAPPGRARVARPTPRLIRRFHVGDLLAATIGDAQVSARGAVGVRALALHVIRYAPFAMQELDRIERAVRAALFATYPEFRVYTAADVPPPELLPAWRQRLERRFGPYLHAPVLPQSHPLLAAAAAAAAAAQSAFAWSSGSGPRRRFPIGDLLAITTRRPDIAPGGDQGVAALLSQMADRPLDEIDVRGRGGEFRTTVLAAYPELGAYTERDVPRPELLALWMRRRRREFGRFLELPLLPAFHPLRAAPRGSVTFEDAS